MLFSRGISWKQLQRRDVMPCRLVSGCPSSTPLTVQSSRVAESQILRSGANLASLRSFPEFAWLTLQLAPGAKALCGCVKFVTIGGCLPPGEFVLRNFDLFSWIYSLG